MPVKHWSANITVLISFAELSQVWRRDRGTWGCIKEDEGKSSGLGARRQWTQRSRNHLTAREGWILLIPRCQSQTLISWCSQPLDQHQDGYRTDKTKRYVLRLLRQRDSLLENYLWEIRRRHIYEKKSPKCGNCYNHYSQVSPAIKPKVPDWEDWRIFISWSTPSGAADKGQGSQLVAERYSNRRTRTGFEQAGV